MCPFPAPRDKPTSPPRVLPSFFRRTPGSGAFGCYPSSSDDTALRSPELPPAFSFRLSVSFCANWIAHPSPPASSVAGGSPSSFLEIGEAAFPPPPFSRIFLVASGPGFLAALRPALRLPGPPQRPPVRAAVVPPQGSVIGIHLPTKELRNFGRLVPQ